MGHGGAGRGAAPADRGVNPRTPGGRASSPGQCCAWWERQSDEDRRVSSVAASAGEMPGSGDPYWPGPRRPNPAQRPGNSFGPADLLSADELPDGLVVADQCGRVIIFNRAAERLTGIAAGQAVGRELPAALPLADAEGRCWWRQSRPYEGLSIRTRHPERSLYLADGTELLVTVGYVRAPRGGPVPAWPCDRGAVRRLIIPLRRRPEAQHARDGQRRRRPGDPPDHRAARRVEDRGRTAADAARAG